MKIKNLNRNIRSYIILISIILLATFLRTINITENPPELFSDEIINFVSARSIVETGHDLQGRLLPYFSDRVELRPPIYGYSSYLSSKIFGKNAIGLRAPAVFFGIVSIILVYLITLEFFKDQHSALFAAFFMAIIPWHIHYSRVGWEPASFLPFLLTSIYLFIYAINRNKILVLVSSFGMFSITVYTYQTAPLYSFLFLAALIVYHWKYFLKEWKVLFLAFPVTALILIPYILTAFTEPQLYYRASRIFTFSNGLNMETINVFLTNYFAHFSPSFLFINGDPNLRHGAHTGTIYWIMLPLIIAGLIYLITSQTKRKVTFFIIFWIIIYPLGGSLTNDGVPHATRTLIGAPIMCILSGFGMSRLFQSLQSKTANIIYAYALYAFIIILSFASLIKFSMKYYYRYPEMSYQYWEYGHKDIFTKIGELKGDFKRVCMENLNYWNEVQIIEFYASKPHIEYIDNIDDPRCSEDGTILVQKSRRRKYRSSTYLDNIKAPDGRKIYFLFLINNK